MEKYQSLIEILEQKTENLEQAYHEILCEKRQLVSENAQLKHTIQSREKLIQELENEMSHEPRQSHEELASPFDRQTEYELENRIESLENMVKTQHESFEQKMVQRDETISQLTRDLKKKNNEIDSLSEVIIRQEDRIQRLEDESKESKIRLASYEDELENGRKCVELLLTEIGQLETHIVQMGNARQEAADWPAGETSRYSFCSPAFMNSTKTRRTSSPSTSSNDSGLNETSIYSEILTELGVPKLNLDDSDDEHTPVLRRSRKPKGRLEMSPISAEYEILSPSDVKSKPQKLVTKIKKIVKNVKKPKSGKLRRCESSVDVIRSHATQFRF